MGWRTSNGRGGSRVDPRLVIGVLLVASSTAGVWALVAGLDDTVEVYAATTTLPAGTALDEGDLERVKVGLAESGAHYVSVGDLPEGAVLGRTVGEGELVPMAALAEPDGERGATVVVTSRGPLPSLVVPGAVVDVWAAEAGERGEFGAPAVLVPGAEVSQVREPGGIATGDVGASVELLVPREKLAAVLEALASGDAIDLVPARAGR
jgi:hypothetical protein